MNRLFEPLTRRSVRFRNRAWMSPTCQYGAVAGVAEHWRRIHYASRAAGGVGRVLVAATAVTAECRISRGDLGPCTTTQAAVRPQVGLSSGAVGFITGAEQAEHVPRAGQANGVLLGRALPRDPHWPLRANGDGWPSPYQHAGPG